MRGEQINTEEKRCRMREFDNMTKKWQNKTHEEKEKNQGDRNRERKETRSRINTNNSSEKPHERGCNARISTHHALFFLPGRVRFLRSFAHARMSACIVVSSVSDAPISQLAEMRSQPQINDPNCSRRDVRGTGTFLQSRPRTWCVPSPNIHRAKTNIALHTMHINV